MKYLKGTMDLVLTLGANSLEEMHWFMDGSYAAHDDMKGQTGVCMSFGRGGALCKSLKQKINTRSSTETEVVSVDDGMPAMMWALHFLKAQGYPIKKNILYQDNKSAILMETNGKRSCGKRTKHMDIRYFYIKDVIDRGDVQVEFCPTLQMVADFFSKPLQGQLFLTMRDWIMGVTEIVPQKRTYKDALLGTQECVVANKN
jgi:hypothetical protein